MSEVPYELLAVYVDGETKTGKGAAGEAIAAALKRDGWRVYYDVAGNFFRRYTALTRLALGLGENDSLPAGHVLETVAAQLYQSGKIFEKDDDLGDLQRPAISRSVAVLGELDLVQKAGGEWYADAVLQAARAGAQVMVLDGRNPRRRVEEESGGRAKAVHVQAALDLFLTCEAREAARRVLLSRGIADPTAAQLEAERTAVVKRRNQDRHRKARPFLVPEATVLFTPTTPMNQDVLKLSWQHRDGMAVPLTILLDNTHITKPAMLEAVEGLAAAAVNRFRTPRQQSDK